MDKKLLCLQLNLETMSKTLSKVHGEQGSRVLELNLAGQKVFHL